jgi:hypothetical protein
MITIRSLPFFSAMGFGAAARAGAAATLEFALEVEAVANDLP